MHIHKQAPTVGHLKAAALERSKGPIVCARSPVDREKAPADGTNEAVAFEHAKANAEQANVPDQPEANKATVEHAPIDDNSKNRQGLSRPTVQPAAPARASGTKPPRAEDPWSTCNRFACLSGLEEARIRASKAHGCHPVRSATKGSRSAHGMISSGGAIDSDEAALAQTTSVSRSLCVVWQAVE